MVRPEGSQRLVFTRVSGYREVDPVGDLRKEAIRGVGVFRQFYFRCALFKSFVAPVRFYRDNVSILRHQAIENRERGSRADQRRYGFYTLFSIDEGRDVMIYLHLEKITHVSALAIPLPKVLRHCQ